MVGCLYHRGQEILYPMHSFTPQRTYILNIISLQASSNLSCVLCLFSLAALELRLEDGAHRCEGRVEVKHQGEWGTVDDYRWSLEDASVVCRQLGCGAAIGFPGGACFGPGLGPIWLLYTSCEGTESTISDCTHSDIKDYHNNSCSHDRDAGVVCSGKSCLI